MVSEFCFCFRLSLNFLNILSLGYFKKIIPFWSCMFLCPSMINFWNYLMFKVLVLTGINIVSASCSSHSAQLSSLFLGVFARSLWNVLTPVTSLSIWPVIFSTLRFWQVFTPYSFGLKFSFETSVHLPLMTFWMIIGLLLPKSPL